MCPLWCNFLLPAITFCTAMNKRKLPSFAENLEEKKPTSCFRRKLQHDCFACYWCKRKIYYYQFDGFPYRSTELCLMCLVKYLSVTITNERWSASLLKTINGLHFQNIEIIYLANLQQKSHLRQDEASANTQTCPKNLILEGVSEKGTCKTILWKQKLTESQMNKQRTTQLRPQVCKPENFFWKLGYTGVGFIWCKEEVLKYSLARGPHMWL